MERFLVGVVDASRVNTVLDYGGDKGQHIPHMFDNCTRYVYDISNVETVGDIKIVNEITDLGLIDFVMASNVFEHLPYPNDAMDAIKNVCGRDTMFFIDVPLEIGEDDVLSDDAIPFIFHEHINCFTPRSLSVLFNQNGFRVAKIEVIPIDFGWSKGKSVYAVGRPNW